MNGDIKLHFVPTEYQIADLFTKPLDKTRFNILISIKDLYVQWLQNEMNSVTPSDSLNFVFNASASTCMSTEP